MSVSKALDQIEKVHGFRPKIAEDIKPSRWTLVCNHLLELYNLCKEFHSLPAAGGVEDQDYLIMHYFSIISSCVAEQTRRVYGRKAPTDHNRGS